MRAPLLLLLLLLLGPAAAAAAGAAAQAAVRCERTAWCDHRGRCTEVCARGTVAVEPWLAAAMAWQNRLARTVPLCRAQLLGGHNSGITLADGYGEMDSFFTSLLRRLPLLGGGTVQTHNQVLSLTDQLRLGVRLIELDTHYMARLGGEGTIKVAHCGGVGSDKVDGVIRELNRVAEELHVPELKWDTRTFGCERSFLSELREIAAWLRDPANAGEFLLIFLDDQSDLETFGEVPHLLEHITSVFGTEVFTPRDLAVAREGEGLAGPSAWPSMGEMGRMGRRVLFMSGARYRGSEDLMFVKDDVCGWAEPAVEDLREWPSCGGGELDRSLVRVNACELQYGPLNCEGRRAPNGAPLDPAAIRQTMRCSAIPCPDNLVPEKAAAAVWSFAEGEVAAEGECTRIAAQDGRWRRAACGTGSPTSPTACRTTAAWERGMPPTDLWRLETAGRGNCGAGRAFSSPHNAFENEALRRLLSAEGVDYAWVSTRIARHGTE